MPCHQFGDIHGEREQRHPYNLSLGYSSESHLQVQLPGNERAIEKIGSCCCTYIVHEFVYDKNEGFLVSIRLGV